MLKSVDTQIEGMLHFTTDTVTPVEKTNFRRNKQTLELLGHLQKMEGEQAPGHEGVDMHTCNAKPGFAHHEAAVELLQFLDTADRLTIGG